MGFVPEGLAREGEAESKHTTTAQAGSHVPEINLSLDALPSKGLPYPKDAVIKYRPYTFGEIKQMNGSKLSETDSYEFILKGIATSFDKYDLSASDALYIGFLRRISTLGTGKFKFTYACTACGGSNTEVMALDGVEFHDLSAPSLPVTVDLSLGQYKFDVLRMRGFLDFLKTTSRDEIAAISHMCVSHKAEEVAEMMPNMTLEDVELIEMVDKYLDHGIKPLELECGNEVAVKRSKTQRKEKCAHKNICRVEGGDNLVQPFRESEKPLTDRIHFG